MQFSTSPQKTILLLFIIIGVINCAPTESIGDETTTEVYDGACVCDLGSKLACCMEPETTESEAQAVPDSEPKLGKTRDDYEDAD